MAVCVADVKKVNGSMLYLRCKIHELRMQPLWKSIQRYWSIIDKKGIDRLVWSPTRYKEIMGCVLIDLRYPDQVSLISLITLISLIYLQFFT
jgi:hypothetical protein